MKKIDWYGCVSALLFVGSAMLFGFFGWLYINKNIWGLIGVIGYVVCFFIFLVLIKKENKNG
jgi:hypothetical protein